jgi:hypothetical protein
MLRSGGSRQHSFFRRSWPGHVLWPIAVILGAYWGQSTVNAFSANYVGAPDYGAASSDPVPVSRGSDVSGLDGQALSCGKDCSDYSLGYHWAEISETASIADCSDSSWSFRRGCLAYLHATGQAAAPEEKFVYVPPQPVRRVAARRETKAVDEDLTPFEGGLLTLGTTVPATPAVESLSRTPAAASAIETPPVPPVQPERVKML